MKVSENVEKDIWEIMYNKARAVQNARVLSPFIEAGGVAAAILTKSGHIYVGVCIDTASTLGMCAERKYEMVNYRKNVLMRIMGVSKNGGNNKSGLEIVC